VEPSQIIFGGVMVGLLLVLAGFFGWRQVRTLRQLRHGDSQPAEDQRYARNQAWRRLVCSACMVLLAGFLAGGLFFLEAPAEEYARQRAAAPADGGPPPWTEEQRNFARLYGWYWLSALLVLLVMLVLAGFDIRAIRRYGQRHHRKLQEDRRAMIARQVARLRQERNGQGHDE
jgi:hypothetical protein